MMCVCQVFSVLPPQYIVIYVLVLIMNIHLRMTRSCQVSNTQVTVLSRCLGT